MRTRIAVLASGRGSNLQALIDARDQGHQAIDLVVVGSDRPHCQAIERARAARIDHLALRGRDFPDRASFDRALFEAVLEFQPQLIVLAGFMRILDADVVGACPVPMLNIHPSLLPAYPGLHTHARVLAAGEPMHGASVHRVIADLDAGPVLAQVRIAVLPDDTQETLAQRLLPREHALLLACLKLHSNGRIRLTPAEIQFDGARLTSPLQLDFADELQIDPAYPAAG